VVSSLVAAVIVLAVGGFAAVTSQWQRAEAEKLRGEQRLYANHIALAQHAWQSGDMEQSNRLLDEAPTQLHGWEWHYMKRLSQPLLTHVSWQVPRSKTRCLRVTFSPDGRHLATICSGNEVEIRNASTGHRVSSLKHDDLVRNARYSPDGKWLATMSKTEQRSRSRIAVWDVESGKVIAEREGGSASYGDDLAFSPDGSRLASSSKKKGVRFEVWNPETGDDVLTLEVDGYGHAVEFSPDGKLIAATSRDGIQFCAAESGALTRTIPVEDAYRGTISFSPSGDRIATIDAVWNVETGEHICRFPEDAERAGRAVFTRDGQAIVIGTQYKLTVFDPVSGRKLRDFNQTEIGLCESVAISPDGRRLATLGEGSDRTTNELAFLSIWDTGFAQPDVRATRKRSGVSDVAISHDGRFVVSVGKVSDSYDPRGYVAGDARVYDARTGEMVLQLDGSPQVRCLDISDDGSVAISGDHDNAARVWDAQAHVVVRELTGHSGAVRCVALDPEARRAATGSDDGTVIIFNLQDGKKSLVLEELGRPVVSVAFSPDGSLIAGATAARATGADGKAAETRVWNAGTGEEVSRLDGGTSIAFGPHGQQIALVDLDGDQRVPVTASVRNLATGETVQEFPEFEGAITHVAWSENGDRIAIGGTEFSIAGSESQATAKKSVARVFVYDAETGEPVSGRIGRPGDCTALDISADGKVVCSATSDESPPLWYHPDERSTSGRGTRSKATIHAIRFVGDSTTTALVHADGGLQFAGSRLVYCNDEAAHLAKWSPTDNRLATACHDGKVRVWKPGSQQPVLVLDGATERIEHLAWNKDGTRIAVADGKTIRVWSTDSGELVSRFASPSKTVAWHPDGDQLAARGATTPMDDQPSKLTIWNAESGKLTRTFSLQLHEDLTHLEWSPDGSWIAGGIGPGPGSSRRSIRMPRSSSVWVWHVKTGEQATWPGGQSGHQTFAWHPTENQLVTVVPVKENSHAEASTHLELVVWDPGARRMRSLSGSIDQLLSRIVVSPDGQRIAASSLDHTIRMWDFESGQEVLTLRRFDDWVTDVAFSTDGHQLVAGCVDGTTAIFDAQPVEGRRSEPK
jgi:WD40 repeat protein